MNRRSLLSLAALSAVFFLTVAADTAKKSSGGWSLTSTIIEACSCPMFCQCYFNTEPAVHAGDQQHKGHDKGHYCRFNMAHKVDKGHYGATNLTGAKFWIAGDLGSEFSDMEGDWAVVTFDPAVTKAQREGIAAILGKLYPIKYKSFSVGQDAPVTWVASKDAARAALDGGKAGEIVLKRFQGHTNEPVVIKNLKYFGEDRNNGFVMMPNEVEAWRLGDKAFEYRGTNGFMITTHIASKPAKKVAAR